MKRIRIHNNQIAINVKREPSIDFTEAQEAGIRENQDFVDSQWWDQVAVQCNIVEKYLRKRYPSFDIRVSMAGRSGGWCEMSGNWGAVYEFGSGYLVPDNYSHAAYADEVGREHKNKYRILTGFIIPVFEREVDAALARFKEWCLSFVDGLSMAVCVVCAGDFPINELERRNIHGSNCPSDEELICHGCLESAAKLEDEAEKARLYFHIDLDERGYFLAHVENGAGNIIWSVEETEMEELIEDGFMRSVRDMAGLSERLSFYGKIDAGADITYMGIE